MKKIVLFIGLLLVIYFDGRFRKIPNKLSISLALFGLFYNMITNGLLGFMTCMTGFLVGLSLLFIPFILNGVGAGDVKLLAAIGSIQGVKFVVNTFLYGAIIGGFWSIIILLRQGSLVTSIKKIFWNVTFRFFAGSQETVSLKKLSDGKEHSFSYGIPMCIAAFIVAYFPFPFSF